MFTILRHMVWPWYGKRCDSMVLLIFQYYAKRLAGKNVSEMTIFCVEWVVKIHSVDQSIDIFPQFMNYRNVKCCVLFTKAV